MLHLIAGAFVRCVFGSFADKRAWGYIWNWKLEERAMGRNVRVAVDAMGGDNAPGEIVKGALEALKASKDLTLVVVGQQKPLERELKKYQYDKSRVEVVFATEVIEMAEPPVVAIRKKKDSSICVGLNMVKQKKADAFVSSGSTGAV